MAFIYCIMNKINNKKYIGKTEHKDPYKRFLEHKKDMHRKYRKNRALYKAMNKYGIENFSFEVIEEVSSELASEKEQYYINLFDTYKNGYNLTLGGDGSPFVRYKQDEIIERYLSGQSINQICSEMQHDHKTISKILKENGIKISYTPKNKKPVAQIDKKTNEIIKIFPSAYEAEKEVPSGKHINQVCKGSKPSAGGYKWAYYDGEMSEFG